MDLEIVILGEVRQRRRNIYGVPYMWKLKGNGTNELTYRNRPAGFKSKLNGYLYTRLYLKRITNKDLLYSTGNSAQWYVAARMGGELGENGYMDMCS